MAHNDFVREDGQWPPETVPTALDYALFDRYQSKGLRPKQTANPTAPIILGQAGLRLTGHDHLIAGGVRTERDGRLVLDDADYPGFEAPRTRTVMVPFGVGLRSSFATQDAMHAMSVDPFGLRITAVDTSLLVWPIPPEYMHDGATLTQAILRFRVGQEHYGVPGFLPRFALRRLPIGHGSSDYLAAGGGPGSGGGATLSPSPSTAADYYAAGAVQAITLPCTMNNVIDAGAFSYALDLSDEQGTNAAPGNLFHSLTLTFSVSDARPE